MEWRGRGIKEERRHKGEGKEMSKKERRVKKR